MALLFKRPVLLPRHGLFFVYKLIIFVTVHGFKGSGFRGLPAFGGAEGDQGSTNNDTVESHQWLGTCERMKKTTLNLACRRSGSGEL
jgi:hypothetical protein